MTCTSCKGTGIIAFGPLSWPVSILCNISVFRILSVPVTQVQEED